jgi:hypothetical protein
MGENELAYSKNAKYDIAEKAIEIDNQQPSL